jgi:hypothetical protein
MEERKDAKSVRPFASMTITSPSMMAASTGSLPAASTIEGYFAVQSKARR